MSTSSVALVHDYLTQRGGAERVVLAMARALDTQRVYTSLFDPPGTFPEFADLDVRSSWLDRVPGLRRHHRAAFPLLAPVFSRLEVDSEVTICSSSGWAHGVRTSGRKIVYCHAPARWLYQTDRYLGTRAGTDVRNVADRLRLGLKRAALSLARGQLEEWDKQAALSADRYLVNSTAVAASVQELYGIQAEVLPPPPALGPDGPVQAIDGVEPGFWLCVSRLLRYKHVDAVVEAMLSRRCGPPGHSRSRPGSGLPGVAGRGSCHFRRCSHRRAASMVLRQLSSARNSLLRRLRPYAARGCLVRQTKRRTSIRGLPRHNRRRSHRRIHREPGRASCRRHHGRIVDNQVLRRGSDRPRKTFQRRAVWPPTARSGVRRLEDCQSPGHDRQPAFRALSGLAVLKTPPRDCPHTMKAREPSHR